MRQYIEKQMNKIKAEKRIGLMTHVVVGYPTLHETKELLYTMADSGVDFIELQIPFSDPLADGPTIMRACEVALNNGVTVRDAFSLVKEVREKVAIPLFFMAYYNTVFRYGVEKFCRDASAVGISGLIVPDMPIEEEKNEYFFAYCTKYNISHIHVVSPISTERRLALNAEVANGFVYVTARQGTTGAKNELNIALQKTLQRVRKIIKQPIAVGFGISKREHILLLKEHADIAVIGSAIIDIINDSKEENRLTAVHKFIEGLRK